MKRSLISALILSLVAEGQKGPMQHYFFFFFFIARLTELSRRCWELLASLASTLLEIGWERLVGLRIVGLLGGFARK